MLTLACGRGCCDHQQKFTSTSKINIVLEILLMDHITLMSFVVQCSFSFSRCLNDELRAYHSVILVTVCILAGVWVIPCVVAGSSVNCLVGPSRLFPNSLILYLPTLDDILGYWGHIWNICREKLNLNLTEHVSELIFEFTAIRERKYLYFYSLIASVDVQMVAIFEWPTPYWGELSN